MKRILFFAGTAMAITMAACTGNSNADNTPAPDTVATTTTVVTDTNTSVVVNPQGGSSVILKEGELPAPVQEAFVLKYPKVTAMEWNVYTPGPSDEDLDLSKPYYYTKVNEGGKEYWAWYDDKGMWIKDVYSMPKDSRLPDPVNKTINDQYPGYTIEEVSKENDKDMEMYEIKLNKGDMKAKLKVLPDGTVFKRKEKAK